LAGVTAKHLIKYFTVSKKGKRLVKAVDDVSFTINDGEFFTFLGPSGCGKTTTLRCIAGLETPDSGELYIGDKPVTDLPPAKRGVSMVFQDYALYPFMNVFDNIAFYLKLRHLSREESKAEVHDVAKLLHIEDLLDRKIDQLSGGQKQRVAIARALVAKPKVYLMDEPLANLDQKIRLEMRSELRKLFNGLGATVVYVTHDQGEALSMSDRIAIMNNGIIEQLGNPSNIYDDPENLFTASFIGSPAMNFIDCNLVRKDGTVVLDAGEFSFILPSMNDELRRAKSDRLIVGIRPEDIEMKRGEGKLVCQVDLVEPLGDKKYVDVKKGQIKIKIEADPEVEVNVGDDIGLEFNEDKIKIFEKESGKRLI
jgi:multiple sugar transport system ATP-binding protein